MDKISTEKFVHKFVGDIQIEEKEFFKGVTYEENNICVWLANDNSLNSVDVKITHIYGRNLEPLNNLSIEQENRLLEAIKIFVTNNKLAFLFNDGNFMKTIFNITDYLLHLARIQELDENFIELVKENSKTGLRISDALEKKLTTANYSTADSPLFNKETKMFYLNPGDILSYTDQASSVLSLLLALYTVFVQPKIGVKKKKTNDSLGSDIKTEAVKHLTAALQNNDHSDEVKAKLIETIVEITLDKN